MIMRNISRGDLDNVLCGSSALEYCVSYSTMNDMVSCIYHHNARCHNNKQYSGLGSSTTGYSERQIQFEIFIAVIYLSIPSIIAIWALYRMLHLSRESLQQINFYLNNPPGEDRSERHQPPHLDLSFLKISFFVKVNTTTTHLGLLRSFRNTCVLDQVTGSFRAQQVSAIMGPSGSGKTTLLKLIGGRMYSGEFFGIRSINSEVPSAASYDSDMRAQGFVAQSDVLIPQLTVWQTVMFAALLRMPPRGELQEKLKRARAVLSDVGLLNAQNHAVGTPTGAQKSISGGQRRRLSIAQELIGSPSMIFLDEPTSGLDASNSLRIIQLLHFISRKRGTSIVLTIHQPRSEAFELFDSLLLLGQGGKMIYSGSCCNAQALLSSCPAINLDTTRCDNPGDFIIDVLGLEDEDSEANDCSDLDQSFVSLHSVPSELDSFMKSPRKLKPDLCYELSSHFLQSSEYIMLLRAIEEDIRILQRPLDLDFRDFGVFAEAPIHSEPPRSHSDKGMRERNGQGVNEGEEEEEEFLDDDDDNDEEKGTSSIAMHALASPEDRMVREFLASSQQDSVRSRPSFLLPSILSDADAGRTSRWAGNWLEVKVLQTWVLFARRVTILSPRPVKLLWSVLQMVLIASTITIAFSYSVQSKLEEPYQIFMLIFTLSSYAMILQYLLLVPEYFSERAVTFAECSSGISSYLPYVVSLTLTEVPRAILHCLLLYGVMYLIHPLNPSTLHASFAFLCLMVGVCAWQSVLCMCSVLSDKISVAYTIAFLALGSGTLFGGLLVSFQNIPEAFRYVYHFSVTAVTQRALIVNDMDCCYLTVSCDSFQSDLLESKDSFSSFPTNSSSALRLCDDVNEQQGNLGHSTLELLSLDSVSTMGSLIFLIWSSLVCRVIAILILSLKEHVHYRLRHVDEEFLSNNWRNLRSMIQL